MFFFFIQDYLIANRCYNYIYMNYIKSNSNFDMAYGVITNSIQCAQWIIKYVFNKRFRLEYDSNTGDYYHFSSNNVANKCNSESITHLQNITFIVVNDSINYSLQDGIDVDNNFIRNINNPDFRKSVWEELTKLITRCYY